MKRVLLISTLLIFELAALAQTVSVRGTVVDETKALIPGVTVQLEHLDRGGKFTTVTDDSGRFTFLGVSPGNVRITATLPGFQTQTINLGVSATGAVVAVTLKVASVATQVEVTLSSSVAHSVGQVISRGERRQLRAVNGGFRPMNTESYDHLEENSFKRVSAEPRSTFAVDVDTASYANVRRFLNSGEIPPKDAVRIEEFVNYFKYSYAPPTTTHPVAIHTEVAAAPWEPRHRIVRIGIRARDVDLSARARANLVFLIDKGNGHYAYIDSFAEARRVFVDQLSGNLMTIAKDVKLQIEFNPAEVEAYRLIGYENRLLEDADFNDDAKDGGDMGAGHNVTAFYELVPKGVAFNGPDAGPLKYQKKADTQRSAKGELLTVSLRYKQPAGSKSVLLEVPARDSAAAFDNASADFRFAASVAAFGMVLRESPHRGTVTLDDVLRTSMATAGDDPARNEFVQLVRKAALVIR